MGTIGRPAKSVGATRAGDHEAPPAPSRGAAPVTQMIQSSTKSENCLKESIQKSRTRGVTTPPCSDTWLPRPLRWVAKHRPVGHTPSPSPTDEPHLPAGAMTIPYSPTTLAPETRRRRLDSGYGQPNPATAPPRRPVPPSAWQPSNEHHSNPSRHPRTHEPGPLSPGSARRVHPGAPAAHNPPRRQTAPRDRSLPSPIRGAGGGGT